MLNAFGSKIAPLRQRGLGESRNFFLMLVVASATPIATTIACGDDDTTTTSTGAQGGDGGTGGGQGGTSADGSVCKICGDLVAGEAASPAELCGFQGHGMGSALICEADSSCQKFADLYACMCGDGMVPGACNDPMANEACAMNACVNGTADGPCETCIMGACSNEFSGCSMDAI